MWGFDTTATGFDLAAVRLDPKNDGWCAAFLGSMLEASGVAHSGSNLATDYRNWGKDCWAEQHPPGPAPPIKAPKNPPISAIAVFGRKDYHNPKKPNTKYHDGHVGFIAKDAQDNFRLLGGNQSSRVCIADLGWYFRNRTFLGYRWPSECTCPGEADESSETDGPSSE